MERSASHRLNGAQQQCHYYTHNNNNPWNNQPKTSQGKKGTKYNQLTSLQAPAQLYTPNCPTERMLSPWSPHHPAGRSRPLSLKALSQVARPWEPVLLREDRGMRRWEGVLEGLRKWWKRGRRGSPAVLSRRTSRVCVMADCAGERRTESCCASDGLGKIK